MKHREVKHWDVPQAYPMLQLDYFGSPITGLLKVNRIPRHKDGSNMEHENRPCVFIKNQTSCLFNKSCLY